MDMQLPGQSLSRSGSWRSNVTNNSSYIRSSPGLCTWTVTFLIILYIDSVTKTHLSPGTKLTLYVDDLLVYKHIYSYDDYTELQKDINLINNWTSENHLVFNTSKCKLLESVINLYNSTWQWSFGTSTEIQVPRSIDKGKGTGLETEANHVISRTALYVRAVRPLKNRRVRLPIERSSCKQEVDRLRRAVHVVYTASVSAI